MKKYDVLVDFDTPLIAAAASQQKNSVIATFNKNKRQKEFENKTAFNKWLKENDKWRIEDFTIETKSVIVGSVDRALASLIEKANYVKASKHMASCKFVVGGPHGNFRDSVATILPYKGQRGEKPLLSRKLKEALLNSFDVEILQPDGDYESDDLISMYLYEEVGNKDSKRAIMSPDKDLKQCQGRHFDNANPHNPPYFVDEFEGCYNLCFQGLTGDKTDNIQGIPKMTEAVMEKYGLKGGVHLGPATATKILAPCRSISTLTATVADVYRLTFQDIHGEGWKAILDENMRLLKMLDYKGQVYVFTEEWGIE